MLQKIRDNSNGIGSKIFVAFIIAVFALWGIESIVGTLLSDTSEVSVNGTDISEALVDYEADLRTQQIIQSLGDASDIDDAMIREATINELIQQELLIQAADRGGMVISNASLDRQIASTESFQVDGVFNNELAQAVLVSAGYTPSSYRESLSKDLLLNQLITAYSNSGFITQTELENLAALTEQQRSLRYLLIDYFDQALQMEVSDEEISAYYESNQDSYIRAEQVSVDYIVLDREQLREEIEISDDAVRARYNEEVESFQSRVERRASHILLEAFDDAGLETASQLAAELKTRIDDGESFEDLAREYSNDLGSNEYGGDVGYTSGDSFVDEFELALQSLEVGEVSPPVTTEFGVHLIKLTEMSNTDFDSYEEASERIRNDLVIAELTDIYNDQTEELNILAFESFDLVEPSEALGLEIQNSGLFSSQGGAGLAANQSFIDAAFSLEVLDDELNSDVIQLDENTSVVMHLHEHLLPEVRPLEEVRVQIQLQLRADKVRERAQEMGQTILSSLNNDQNINSLLEEQGFEWVQLNDLTRDSQAVNPELLRWIFTLPAPQGDTGLSVNGIMLSAGMYAIVDLESVTSGSVDSMSDEELQAVKEYIAQQSSADDFSSYLTALQSEAKITR